MTSIFHQRTFKLRPPFSNSAQINFVTNSYEDVRAKGEARSLTERACLDRGHVTEISTADAKYAYEPPV